MSEWRKIHEERPNSITYTNKLLAGYEYTTIFDYEDKSVRVWALGGYIDLRFKDLEFIYNKAKELFGEGK